MAIHKISSNESELYLNGQLLIVRYGSGDIDTISAANPTMEHLISALYDEYQCSDILKHGDEIELNGKVIAVCDGVAVRAVDSDDIPKWDYYISENAENPHCGISFYGENFLTCPHSQRENLIKMVSELNAQNPFVKQSSSSEVAQQEILPGATKEEINTIILSDLVGDYDTPDQVPEWKWIENNASFSHTENGSPGTWEFVLNLSREFHDIPDKLKNAIQTARAQGIAYLIFTVGT